MKNEITIDGKTYILKEESTKEFNGLICKPIEQFNTAFKNIKIPYGWRIPTIMEAVDLINNEDFVKWSKFDDEKHDFFIEQPFNKKKGNLRPGSTITMVNSLLVLMKAEDVSQSLNWFNQLRYRSERQTVGKIQMEINLIKESIEDYFGLRCPEYDADCVVCKVWKQLDDLITKCGENE